MFSSNIHNIPSHLSSVQPLFNPSSNYTLLEKLFEDYFQENVLIHYLFSALHNVANLTFEF